MLKSSSLENEKALRPCARSCVSVLKRPQVSVEHAPRHLRFRFVSTSIGVSTEQKWLASLCHRTKKLIYELTELRPSDHRIGYPYVEVHVDDSHSGTTGRQRVRMHRESQDAGLKRVSSRSVPATVVFCHLPWSENQLVCTLLTLPNFRRTPIAREALVEVK